MLKTNKNILLWNVIANFGKFGDFGKFGNRKFSQETYNKMIRQRFLIDEKAE
jgi:hypothetical protein